MKIFKHRRAMYLRLALFGLGLFLAAPAQAVLQIANLQANAASWTAGQDMTVTFDVQSTSGGTIKFSLGISDESAGLVTTNVKKIQWLADEKGIYKNQTSY